MYWKNVPCISKIHTKLIVVAKGKEIREKVENEVFYFFYIVGIFMQETCFCVLLVS